MKISKDPKTINYYQGLKVEGLDHVDESEPELDSVKEPEPKPTHATSTESGSISKSKKRRERRLRNAVTSGGVSEDDVEIITGLDAATPEEMIEESDRAHEDEDTALADVKYSDPRAPGAFLDSDDDDDDNDDNISELNLDGGTGDLTIAPENSTSPSSTTPPANDEAVLTHAVKNKKAALAETEKTPSTRNDDIALFGGYACLILACFAQYGLDEISVAQILLFVGTVGVCVPLEWFAELIGVGEAEADDQVEGEGEGQNGEREVGEKDAVHGEMTDAKLEGVLGEVGAWLKEHENEGIGYGWIAVITMGFVMGYIDARSPPALVALAVSIAVVSFFSGKAVLERK